MEFIVKIKTYFLSRPLARVGVLLAFLIVGVLSLTIFDYGKQKALAENASRKISALNPNLFDGKETIFSSLLKPLAFEPSLITISKIGLKDIKIVQVGIDSDGRLEVPKSFDEVGWFSNGPKAGEDGNAILAGHYDRTTGAPAVFYNLTKLKPGDAIEITDSQNLIHRFEVYDVSYVVIDDSNAVTKAYASSDSPILTLITCGGVWNSYTHDYSKRLLIKARIA